MAVDVDYRTHSVVAAGVEFETWDATEPAGEVATVLKEPPAPYEPGRFYLRELPPILGILQLVLSPLEAIVIDGYVWLAPGRPGLGAYLHAQLGEVTPVIGVAKTAFAGAQAIEVVRGTSARPLYVTATGIDIELAARHVRAMHGEHRIPALLGRVDQLARTTSPEST